MSQEILAAYSDELRTYYIDFTALLEKDAAGALVETIGSVASIEEVTTSDLTLSAKEVNDEPIVKQDGSGDEIAVGAAVQFTCTGGDENETYAIKAIVETTEGHTLVDVLRLQIKRVGP